MSKWRPNKKDCIYVIPDIHGAAGLLQMILDRILPLRKSDGIKDKLIFLGDYIDRHVNSHLVIDKLISLKEKYPDQIIFLMGNHELMLLETLNMVPNVNYSLQTMMASYKMWLSNGGRDTLFGYQQRSNILNNSFNEVSRAQVKKLIPASHIEFLQKLLPYYETEKYIFVHGGLNPTEPVSKQELDNLVWDRQLLKFVQNELVSRATLNKRIVFPWDKTIVCGHSVNANKTPVIHDQFMMLDCGSPTQLLVMELNSKKAFMALPNKDRLVKFAINNTTKLPGLIRRST